MTKRPALLWVLIAVAVGGCGQDESTGGQSEPVEAQTERNGREKKQVARVLSEYLEAANSPAEDSAEAAAPNVGRFGLKKVAGRWKVDTVG